MDVGKGFGRVLVVAAIVLGLVACGGGGGGGGGVSVRTTPEAGTGHRGDEPLDALARAAANGDWVLPVARPGGGVVLIDAASSNGTGQTFDGSGVVVDAEGAVVGTFASPAPTNVVAAVVAGERAHLLGVVCEGTSVEDEQTGVRRCTPGTVVGTTVDLAELAVEPLALPSELAEVGPVLGSGPSALLRAGPDDVVLVAGTQPDRLRTWRSDGEGRWLALDDAPALPCQVGDAVVAPTEVAAMRSAGAHPSVSVLDPATGRWRSEVGQALSLPPDTEVSTFCTRDRFVVFAGGRTAADSTLLTFDPVARTWAAVPVPPVDGVPVALADPGMQNVLISRLGAAERVPSVLLNPVSGRSAPGELSISDLALLAPLTATEVLVASKTGARSTVRQVP